MDKLVQNWGNSLTRRNAVKSLTGFLAGSALLRGQQDVFRDHSRSPGLEELSSAFDFEPIAYSKLPREVLNYTAYGPRSESTYAHGIRVWGHLGRCLMISENRIAIARIGIRARPVGAIEDQNGFLWIASDNLVEGVDAARAVVAPNFMIRRDNRPQ